MPLEYRRAEVQNLVDFSFSLQKQYNEHIKPSKKISFHNYEQKKFLHIVYLHKNHMFFNASLLLWILWGKGRGKGENSQASKDLLFPYLLLENIKKCFPTFQN